MIRVRLKLRFEVLAGTFGVAFGLVVLKYVGFGASRQASETLESAPLVLAFFWVACMVLTQAFKSVLSLRSLVVSNML